MAAALIALAVPTTAGAAEGQGGSISYLSGPEQVGESATYTFECTFSSGQEAEGAQAYLYTENGGSFLGYGSGTFQISYAGRTAGTYQVRVNCFGDGVGGDIVATRAVTVAPAPVQDVATTTTVTVDQNPVYSGGLVGLTATVPGAVGGTVEFFAGAQSLGSSTLSGHVAHGAYFATASTSITAVYSGAPGYLTSTSAAVPLVVTTVGSWDLLGTDDDGNAAPGRTLTAQPTGWPSGTVFTYQWEVNYSDVPGATSATFTPTVAHLGTTVSVQVSATAPGLPVQQDSLHAWSVVTTPTVTVGSSQITVGSDAVVPVTVAGPAGGPVPTGTVDVTLTPTSGTPVVRQGVALVGGSATVTVPGLAVGTYAVQVAYSGEGQMHPRFMLMAVEAHAYQPATGSGTVQVVKPAPVVTPADLTVPVATAGTLDVQIGSPRPERYVLREGSTVLAEGVVPTSGALRITLPVLSPGAHDLVLDLPESATTAAASRAVRVTVTGEPPRASDTPTADLATPKGATTPGQEMDLVAEGFEPGETVAFYMHSDPVFLGTAVAGADGIARLRATIPADAPLGNHTVIATGGTSGRWAQLSIVLGVPTAAPALAATGAQAGGLMTGAWVLLALGGGLVVLARKVRTAR
jgi:hypothetical protein